MLFGQAPDSVVKAWTETGEWALPAKEAPQNIYYDEHYLCTVAAGGHRRVVKPNGFPVARRIRSKWAADFVHFLMKPLGWIFAAFYI